MKIIPNKHPRSLLKLALSLALITACSNSNSSSQSTQTVHINENLPPILSLVDDSSQLKFTTGVRSILEDTKGNFWFGSHQEGVALYTGEKLIYFTEEDGLSDNQVRSIFEDKNGMVWFECGKGISSFDGTKIITHTEKDYNSKNEWQTESGDLWFKGDEMTGYNQLEGEPGVYRYDGKQLKYYTFPEMPKGEGSFYYSVSTPFVRGKNGKLWFGTYGAVFGYDGSSFTIIDDKSLGLTEETGHLHIRSLFEDSKGHLWIGNNGIGVLLRKDDQTINFSKSKGLISKNSENSGGYRSPPGSLEHVFAISEDNDGNIWFGDRDTGAWKYNGQSFENYTLEDGLTSTQIWQIYPTKNGELWFALADGSVCKFNGDSFEKIF